MTTPIISPNMNLPIPVPTESTGPEYAENISDSLEKIDVHNHTPGQGVPIPVSALNINQNLPMSSYSITGIKSLALENQAIAPTQSGSVYMSGNNLYWKDGTGLYTVQITNGNAVAGAPGNITSLVAPANCTYLTGTSTFRFQSNVNVAASLDARNVTLRNSTVSSFAYEMQAPTLSTNRSVVLPDLPAATKILSMTSAGVIASNIDADNSTLEIVANNLQIRNSGVTTAKIANSSVTNDKLASPSGGYASAGLSFNASFSSSPQSFASTNLNITTTRANSYVLAMVTNGAAAALNQSTYRFTNTNDAQIRIQMITGGTFFAAASGILQNNIYYSTPIIGMLQIATPGTYTFQLQAVGVPFGSSQLQIDAMRFILKEIF